MEAILTNSEKAKSGWRASLFNVAVYAYAALWSYAAFIKLSDAERAQIEMKRQVFPPAWGEWIFYLIPCIEIILVIFLMNPATKRKALAASLILISLLSSYMILVLLRVFGSIPCFTGGVYVNWSFGEHLIFNLLLAALAVITLVLTRRGLSRADSSADEGRKERAPGSE